MMVVNPAAGYGAGRSNFEAIGFDTATRAVRYARDHVVVAVICQLASVAVRQLASRVGLAGCIERRRKGWVCTQEKHIKNQWHQ